MHYQWYTSSSISALSLYAFIFYIWPQWPLTEIILVKFIVKQFNVTLYRYINVMGNSFNNER